jgi:hypothetical protein
MRYLFSFLLAFLLLLPGSIPEAEGKSKWSKTTPEINLSHIFHGEINRRGKPTGFHARPLGKSPRTARIFKKMSRPNKAGIYTARVKIWDGRKKIWKKKFSSFFPDNMSRKEVIKAILYAYHHRLKKRKQPWQGPSGHGFFIQGYVTRRGGINTAFPIYVKD